MNSILSKKISTDLTEPKNCIVQLERNDHTLSQIRKKLCSYMNEPKTNSLFEQSEGLKYKMNMLERTNTEILNLFKEQKQIVTNEIEYVKKQFSAISELQLGVDNYITSVRNY